MDYSRLIVWGIDVTDLVLVTVWLYVLFRSVLPRLRSGGPETRRGSKPGKVAQSERFIRTVRSPWIEAYRRPFLALAAFCVPWLILVKYAFVPPGYLAIPVLSILCEMLIWLYCHVHKLVITERSVVLHGGFFIEDIRLIPIMDIDSIELSRLSRIEEMYSFDTIEIKSSSHPAQDIRMTRIPDGAQLKALIERLKEKTDD